MPGAVGLAAPGRIDDLTAMRLTTTFCSIEGSRAASSRSILPENQPHAGRSEASRQVAP
jgi:hypothetical protein